MSIYCQYCRYYQPYQPLYCQYHKIPTTAFCTCDNSELASDKQLKARKNAAITGIPVR